MLATRSVARQTPRVTSRVRARHSFRASAAMSSSAREKDLQTLWADAYDAWLDVPGEPRPSVVYARPAVPDPRVDASDDPAREAAGTAFPAIVTTSRSFALTGFNPMGTKTAMAKNKMANEALREDLASLERPKPRAVWASFGFAHDWREDGFVVAFHEADDVAEARAAIVELAVKYDQGAVYEYAPAPNDPTRLTRKTVPAAMSAGVEADVALERCGKPELALANREVEDDAYDASYDA
jgi:hypothetical protein